MAKVYKYVSKPEHGLPPREVLGIPTDIEISSLLLENIVLGSGLTKKMNTLIGTLIVEENLWDTAMTLAKSENPQIAFRVSWGLEWAYCCEPKELEKRSKKFLRDFLESTNESVNRVYSKMLCDMIRRKAITLSGQEESLVAEKSFDLLIDPETAVAVKVWQIELLTDLVERIDWIEENLTATITTFSQDPDCTPAMAAHARHYFRRIKKMKKKVG